MDSKKRLRSDSVDSQIDSVEAKRILLDILDDSDVNSVSQDLDSFIKTFEDEITPAPEGLAGGNSGETSRPELGFLFEASDDELGLPPTSLAESVELSELWKLDDELTSYDNSFEYEFGYYGNYISSSYKNDDDVAIDGLFEHTDMLWRPETLPA